jgi:tetratricopeptide (TPR) repeat protein
MLLEKLDQFDGSELAQTLRREISDALANLPLIYTAHQKEAEGAFPLAYDFYLRAHKRSPQNTYLMRHLAKTCTRLGQSHYREAIEWWQQVLHLEQHSRFYQHLAEVHALRQEYSAALDCYRLAAEKDNKDPRCYLGWGQVLLATGRYQDALDKFMKARALDEDHQALYILREAEAYASMGNYPQAVAACERALIWDRDNPDAIKMLVQFLPKCS